MRAIFVSYRRDDSEGHAGRLFDDLVQEFGEQSVFMDVTAIEVGRDFRKAIEDSVATCGVLLAIIGRNWVDAKDEVGQRRLDNPYDFVRLEAASALKRDIPVIPVLVHGARMPLAEQLPDDLKELTYRNGVELTHARWDSDLQVLIKALRPHVEDHKIEPHAQTEPEPKPIPPPHSEDAIRRNAQKSPWPALAALAVGVVVIGIVGYLRREVTVPDLTGSTLAHATTALEAAHLGVGRRTYQQIAEKTPDTVLSQSPTRNAKVKSGTPIDLVLSHQPPMTVSGIWRNGKYTFTLTQNGEAVTSEGSFGHADGHFTGPNTLILSWASGGTFTGTAQGDTIYWSNNTSWTRQRVNVSGTWRSTEYTFTLTQNGDAVTSEGSFGHADGHFTGPDTFILNWASGGTFTGTVKGETINWSNNTRWRRQASGKTN